MVKADPARSHPQAEPMLSRKRPLPPETPPQRVVSDLAPDMPVSEAELDALERLLGNDLAAFLGALN